MGFDVVLVLVDGRGGAVVVDDAGPTDGATGGGATVGFGSVPFFTEAPVVVVEEPLGLEVEAAGGAGLRAVGASTC